MPEPEPIKRPVPAVTPDNSLFTAGIVNRIIPRQPVRDIIDLDRLIALRSRVEGQKENITVKGSVVKVNKVFGEPKGEFAELVNARGTTVSPEEAKLIEQKRLEFARRMSSSGE